MAVKDYIDPKGYWVRPEVLRKSGTQDVLVRNRNMAGGFLRTATASQGVARNGSML
jgi:hypothetical protein